MNGAAWDDLLDYIRDDKVVPVIGHQLLKYDGQTLQRRLADR